MASLGHDLCVYQGLNAFATFELSAAFIPLSKFASYKLFWTFYYLQFLTYKHIWDKQTDGWTDSLQRY